MKKEICYFIISVCLLGTLPALGVPINIIPYPERSYKVMDSLQYP